MPGQPFYRELIEEIVKEDCTSSGPDLRDTVLNTLKVADDKPKAVKAAVNYKNILLDGILVIGSAGNTLNEIFVKFDENHAVLENRKKGLIHTIKELIRQITKAEPEEVFYTIEYMEPTKSVPTKEKIPFFQYKDDLEKKIRILNSFVRGPAYQKLANMPEDQIVGHLERNIKDVQNLHKNLSAFDDLFKANVPAEERSKIKGVKPELSALKNSFVKANQLLYEYNSMKEEDEQMKRLGFSSAPEAPPEGDQ